MEFIYEYPRPMVTVDCIVIYDCNNEFEVLLIKRKNEPFMNFLALPGGFVDMDEDLKEAALRELEEETGIKDIEIEQFKTFGKPGRDPRGRNITIVYYCILKDKKPEILAGDDASEALWINKNELPILAFDHNEVLDEFFCWKKI
ncbi:MAG: NUDIX hydrolase [Bacteroidales bacterium]|nr:NUDIX hydrolase [Bacteroidales bacterium]